MAHEGLRQGAVFSKSAGRNVGPSISFATSSTPSDRSTVDALGASSSRSFSVLPALGSKAKICAIIGAAVVITAITCATAAAVSYSLQNKKRKQKERKKLAKEEAKPSGTTETDDKAVIIKSALSQAQQPNDEISPDKTIDKISQQGGPSPRDQNITNVGDLDPATGQRRSDATSKTNKASHVPSDTVSSGGHIAADPRQISPPRMMRKRRIQSAPSSSYISLTLPFPLSEIVPKKSREVPDMEPRDSSKLAQKESSIVERLTERHVQANALWETKLVKKLRYVRVLRQKKRAEPVNRKTRIRSKNKTGSEKRAVLQSLSVNNTKNKSEHALTNVPTTLPHIIAEPGAVPKRVTSELSRLSISNLARLREEADAALSATWQSNSDDSLLLPRKSEGLSRQVNTERQRFRGRLLSAMLKSYELRMNERSHVIATESSGMRNDGEEGCGHMKAFLDEFHRYADVLESEWKDRQTSAEKIQEQWRTYEEDTGTAMRIEHSLADANGSMTESQRHISESDTRISKESVAATSEGVEERWLTRNDAEEEKASLMHSPSITSPMHKTSMPFFSSEAASTSIIHTAVGQEDGSRTFAVVDENKTQELSGSSDRRPSSSSTATVHTLLSKDNQSTTSGLSSVDSLYTSQSVSSPKLATFSSPNYSLAPPRSMTLDGSPKVTEAEKSSWMSSSSPRRSLSPSKQISPSKRLLAEVSPTAQRIRAPRERLQRAGGSQSPLLKLYSSTTDVQEEPETDYYGLVVKREAEPQSQYYIDAAAANTRSSKDNILSRPLFLFPQESSPVSTSLQPPSPARQLAPAEGRALEAQLVYSLQLSQEPQELSSEAFHYLHEKADHKKQSETMHREELPHANSEVADPQAEGTKDVSIAPSQVSHREDNNSTLETPMNTNPLCSPELLLPLDEDKYLISDSEETESASKGSKELVTSQSIGKSRDLVLSEGFVPHAFQLCCQRCSVLLLDLRLRRLLTKLRVLKVEISELERASLSQSFRRESPRFRQRQQILKDHVLVKRLEETALRVIQNWWVAKRMTSANREGYNNRKTRSQEKRAFESKPLTVSTAVLAKRRQELEPVSPSSSICSTPERTANETEREIRRRRDKKGREFPHETKSDQSTSGQSLSFQRNENEEGVKVRTNAASRVQRSWRLSWIWRHEKVQLEKENKEKEEKERREKERQRQENSKRKDRASYVISSAWRRSCRRQAVLMNTVLVLQRKYRDRAQRRHKAALLLQRWWRQWLALSNFFLKRLMKDIETEVSLYLPTTSRPASIQQVGEKRVSESFLPDEPRQPGRHSLIFVLSRQAQGPDKWTDSTRRQELKQKLFGIVKRKCGWRIRIKRRLRHERRAAFILLREVAARHLQQWYLRIKVSHQISERIEAEREKQRVRNSARKALVFASAVKIQSWWRSLLARSLLHFLRAQRRSQLISTLFVSFMAAKKIQRWARRKHKERQKKLVSTLLAFHLRPLQKSEDEKKINEKEETPEKEVDSGSEASGEEENDERKEAAIKIESWWRGLLCRADAAYLKAQEKVRKISLLWLETNASVRIQCWWRALKGKKEYGMLCDRIRERQKRQGLKDTTSFIAASAIQSWWAESSQKRQAYVEAESSRRYEPLASQRALLERRAKAKHTLSILRQGIEDGGFGSLRSVGQGEEDHEERGPRASERLSITSTSSSSSLETLEVQEMALDDDISAELLQMHTQMQQKGRPQGKQIGVDF